MRRADRLFQIVQFLRGRRLTTARWLAERLEVSERTVYRDVRDLMLSGVPIEGEAGVGYTLRHKLDLPPLMFDREELTALRLGAEMAAAWSDPQLARAAQSALAKIDGALPGDMRRPTAPLLAPSFDAHHDVSFAPLREAIDSRRVVELDYRKPGLPGETRRVQPLALLFWGAHWTLAAWCELRGDHRHFRLDRIEALRTLDERFDPLPERSLRAWMQAAGAPPDAFDGT
ncbi:helix-turn-helix transcriptional regulator [Chitinimonas koreensis]|uniref:helix-turn-helix transcriptional regulator n=1 Tax=Chitinimonas koreensis TaxID=356302 RepID=UPI0004049C23|nr:YafY family protein [Chitinimonas koreensis]QNM95966.1 YafY family transcriptional regulator [Chitinimonas koreensis]